MGYLADHAPEIEAAVEEHNQKVYGGEMPVENKQVMRDRIKFLLKHAKPGNIPFYILENEFGLTGDYSEADVGEAPHGAYW